MASPWIVQCMAGAGLLMALGALFTAVQRREHRRLQSLRLSASSIWELDQAVRTLDIVLRTTPELQRVWLDLSRLHALDDSARGALDYVSARLRRASVEFHIEGCTGDVRTWKEDRERHSAATRAPDDLMPPGSPTVH